MNYQEYLASLATGKLPSGLSTQLQALWFAGNGNWEKAHELIQDLPDKGSALIHAYLHREEGDEWNAGYWYAKAGRKNTGGEIKEEWEVLVREFLEK